MRVLFLSNYYPPFEVGGYEQLCRDVAERLAERGHTVAVLTSDFREATRGTANSNEKVLDNEKRDLWQSAPAEPTSLVPSPATGWPTTVCRSLFYVN